MQINASSLNSINFIEQKKSNTSSLNEKDNSTLNQEDSFISKTTTTTSLLELNTSLGTLQVADNTLQQLQNKNQELQKLTEKYIDFPSQESELNEKFEEITVEILDIVDNTMVKDTQLFYTTHVFSMGSVELELTLQNDFGIEDFNLFSSEELKGFDTKIANVEKEIEGIKSQVELVSFNKMASLQSNSPLLDINRKINTEELVLNVEDIKRAHDINSLKDNVSFLLGDYDGDLTTSIDAEDFTFSK